MIHIISKQTIQFRRNITIHVHDDNTNNIGTETFIVSSILVRRKRLWLEVQINYLFPVLNSTLIK